jgi:CO/xanthine dehydrogenase FAD-binding subunit
MTELKKDPLVNEYATALSDAAGMMGSPLIRNLATIGGNLANSSPAGDMFPPLTALSAVLEIQTGPIKVEVPISSFCHCPGGNALAEGEIIASIKIPVMEGSKSGFLKMGARKALAISKLSVAAWWIKDKGKISNICIAMGAVGPKCLRATATEDLIKGEVLTQDLLKGAMDTMKYEASAIDDFRSTKEYRNKMLGLLLKRILG